MNTAAAGVGELPITPDFHDWPVTHRIEAARVVGGHVQVHWDDGRVSRFHFRWLRGGECRVETVVITRRYGIKLVIVAFAASHWQREHRLADVVHQVVQVSLPSFFLRDHGSAPRSHA